MMGVNKAGPTTLSWDPLCAYQPASRDTHLPHETKYQSREVTRHIGILVLSVWRPADPSFVARARLVMDRSSPSEILHKFGKMVLAPSWCRQQPPQGRRRPIVQQLRRLQIHGVRLWNRPIRDRRALDQVQFAALQPDRALSYRTMAGFGLSLSLSSEF
ncbi:hypothetical protein GQ55_5G460200 [Panicum hallii var. hallii]|uniref:Uncharacterized protein n=1 Tax=Panicum hallii var. hallii TaxID=1504633 RepID=A0A2T7DQG7_9POAL|nr:hypothetical protein GQ55_5G460200 [Panicum hallii var. hallii]